MASTTDLALLALRAYSTPGASATPQNTELNRPAVPTGWIELEWHADEVDGFSYGVYQNGTEIVLAYAGTGQGLDVDWVANLTNGVGLSSTQTTKAALAYLTAKQQYGSNITLTGHSLGGGLASVMAVWFDRPAVVFDEAPFEFTARNPLVIGATYAALTTAGFDVGAFAGYTGILDFYAREARVSNYFTQNEALLYLRLAWPTIVGATDEVIVANVADMTSTGAQIDLHSQALLTALVMSQNFQLATYASTRVLPLLMDESLYAYSTKGDKENVLINFIRSEQSAVTGQGKLTHFAIDLNKLGTNIAGLNQAAQDALIAQGIEWYYWQSSSYAGQQFFANNVAQPNLLQYTTAQGAGLQGAQNKASEYVRNWLSSAYTASTGDTRFAPMGTAFDQWNVAAGSTGVTATALDVTKSQIYIGGTGADTFTGGNLSDVILAGDGADTLNGGAGYDLLYGGGGADTYNFTASFGGDRVLDADGLGSLWVDGVQLTGGKLLSDNVWESDGSVYRYTLMGGSLLIGRGSNAGTTMQGTITVQGWTATESLGIILDNAPVVNPVTGALFFNGDISASAAGSNGSVMHGYGGNDVLSGGGNAPLENAIGVVTDDAWRSETAGRFDCETTPHKTRSQCFRWRSDCSHTKNAHARSMRLAGHKWPGRRMDSAWSIPKTGGKSLTAVGQREATRNAMFVGLSFHGQTCEVQQ